VEMKTAVIYSNGSQECERIAMLLRNLDGEFHEYELDKHFTIEEFNAEFGEDAQFPQVSIGYKHIGDMKETLNYMKDKGMFV